MKQYDNFVRGDNIGAHVKRTSIKKIHRKNDDRKTDVIEMCILW